MSRKPRIDTDGAPPLSDNPFAALAGALGELPPGVAPEAPPEHAPPPAELREKIVLRREKKGRGGKTVTVIEGLQRSADVMQTMARELRRSLGCAVHVEAATIVVGGAQAERIREWLAARGATRIVIGN